MSVYAGFKSMQNLRSEITLNCLELFIFFVKFIYNWFSSEKKYLIAKCLALEN